MRRGDAADPGLRPAARSRFLEVLQLQPIALPVIQNRHVQLLPTLFALVFEPYSIIRSNPEHLSERVTRIREPTDNNCDLAGDCDPADTVEQMFDYLADSD